MAVQGERVLLATAAALLVHQDGRLEILAAGLPHLRALAGGAGGEILLATDEGFLRWMPGSTAGGAVADPFAGRGPQALALQAEPGGALWLGTLHGLWRACRGEASSSASGRPIRWRGRWWRRSCSTGAAISGSAASTTACTNCGGTRCRPGAAGRGSPARSSTRSPRTRTAGCGWPPAAAASSRFDPRSGRLEPRSPPACPTRTCGRWRSTRTAACGPAPTAAACCAGWPRRLLAKLRTGKGLARRTGPGGADHLGRRGLAGHRQRPRPFPRRPRSRSSPKPTACPRTRSATSSKTRNGNLWIATMGGLARHHGGGRFEPFTSGPLVPEGVLSIWQDEQGALWLATVGGPGAGRRGPGPRAHHPRRPLLRRPGACAIGDGFGYLWMGTAKGLLRVSPRRAAGPPGRPGERAASLDLRPPERLPRPASRPTPPPPSPAAPAASTSPAAAAWSTSIPSGCSLPAPPAQVDEVVETPRPWWQSLGSATTGSRLAFRFSAATLAAPGELRLRYRLEGFDPAWRAAGKSSTRRIQPGAARHLPLPGRNQRPGRALRGQSGGHADGRGRATR